MKSCKIAAAPGALSPETPLDPRHKNVGGRSPQTPVLLLPPTNIAWSAHPFLALKIKQTGKCFAFASSALLHLFFIFNSAISVGGGAKIFFAPGRRVS